MGAPPLSGEGRIARGRCRGRRGCTGLGLALAQALGGCNGGRVELRRAAGTGTVASVLLPGGATVKARLVLSAAQTVTLLPSNPVKLKPWKKLPLSSL